MRSLRRALVLSILAILAGCQAPQERISNPTPKAPFEEGNVLTLGDIEPDDPVKVHESLRTLADYLEVELAPFGVGRVGIKIAPNIGTMAGWIAEGEVDLFFDSPYPALTVSRRSGARIILRRWKNGVPEYHSVIFTHIEGGLSELSDLRGETIAFDDSASTTGYFLPKAVLQQAGLLPIAADQETAFSEGEVTYVFAGDDTAVVEWVLADWSKAGAIDNLTFEGLPASTREALRVIARSETVPRHLALIRAEIDSRLEEALTLALLDIHNSASGQEVLESLESSRFDIPEQGIDQVADRARQLLGFPATPRASRKVAEPA